MTSVKALAHPNIALIKYWGKRDAVLNLPAVGSISITLDTFETVTELTLGSVDRSAVYVNGRQDKAAADNIKTMMATACDWLGRAIEPFRVESSNNFPTAAGLASSASAYAAVAVALNAALGAGFDTPHLSRLARLGSGSAARSIFGGFVEMRRGEAADGTDAHAVPMRPSEFWPLSVVVAICQRGPKTVSSRQGMSDSAAHSPFYAPFVAAQPSDLATARTAIEARDFNRLAAVAEASCLKMHAVMLATPPGLLYWQPATLAAMRCVRKLRDQGCPVFFTIDAGPQVKAICPPEHANSVRLALSAVDGVQDVLTTGLGGGARLATH